MNDFFFWKINNKLSNEVEEFLTATDGVEMTMIGRIAMAVAGDAPLKTGVDDIVTHRNKHTLSKEDVPVLMRWFKETTKNFKGVLKEDITLLEKSLNELVGSVFWKEWRYMYGIINEQEHDRLEGINHPDEYYEGLYDNIRKK